MQISFDSGHRFHEQTDQVRLTRRLRHCRNLQQLLQVSWQPRFLGLPGPPWETFQVKKVGPFLGRMRSSSHILMQILGTVIRSAR
jgi:hypothetical protein